MNQALRYVHGLLAFTLLAASPVRAQDYTPDTEVPRTRTFPGTEDPAFPYAEPEEVGLSSEKLDRLGDEIAGWVAGGDIVGGELLIVKDGRAIFHEAYGWSDREERRPMSRNAIVSIKSMSKPFAATAILMLAEDGRLSLDDPVAQYIPGFAGDERTAVRHLLAHTSGYAGLGGNALDFDTLREWVEAWAAQEPTERLGSYSYSDFNTGALGYIVEDVAGVPAETFITEHIIEPLGLDETYTTFSPDVPWADRVGSRYRWDVEAHDYERFWTPNDPQPWTFYPAAWGLWGTAMDYAKFLTLWLNGGRYGDVRLLSEETVEEALRAHATLGELGTYGYGWELEGVSRDAAALPIFGHGGSDGTTAMALPADGALVVFLTQSQRVGTLTGLKNRLALLGALSYAGPGMVWADGSAGKTASHSTEGSDLYVGSYAGRFPWEEDDTVVEIWEEDGRLYHRMGGRIGRTDHLVPLGDHHFTLGRFSGTELEAVMPDVAMRFRVDEGRATALEVMQSGEVVFAAQRVDPEQTAWPDDR